ncbi:hypothetical protein Agub_g4492 [Astrephomene gubernaculifera]|uniref:Uncharacterized protein n=1 Tax=Astrephomene gubernaculifera TaxID=47775 RepID=A0AAD3DP64_9CHLO|nr:hypothetical protein Agub_g4492 [Astrephomene gubernaculifera]
MSSNALPPLAGVGPSGSKDDRDDQRTPKVKPLPLMLSTRAPLVGTTGASRSRSVPSPTHPSSPYLAHLHPNHGSPGDAPTSPASPGQQSGGASFRSNSSKFTRLRGIQGGGGSSGAGGMGSAATSGGGGQQQQQQGPQLALEGNSMLQPQSHGADGSEGQAASPQHQLYHPAPLVGVVAVPVGAVSNGGSSNSNNMASVGGSRSPGSAAGGSGSSGGAAVVMGGPAQINLALPSPEGSLAGVSAAYGQAGSGAGGAAWASRRGNTSGPPRTSASTATAAGAGGGGVSLQRPVLEGVGTAGGGNPLGYRPSHSAASPRHLTTSILPAGGGSPHPRPDTAPLLAAQHAASSSSSPPLPTLDLLAATFPSGRTNALVPGSVPPAAMNPPMYGAPSAVQAASSAAPTLLVGALPEGSYPGGSHAATITNNAIAAAAAAASAAPTPDASMASMQPSSHGPYGSVGADAAGSVVPAAAAEESSVPSRGEESSTMLLMPPPSSIPLPTLPQQQQPPTQSHSMFGVQTHPFSHPMSPSHGLHTQPPTSYYAQQQLLLQPQPSTTAQLLQKLYRTNLTPPTGISRSRPETALNTSAAAGGGGSAPASTPDLAPSSPAITASYGRHSPYTTTTTAAAAAPTSNPTTFYPSAIIPTSIPTPSFTSAAHSRTPSGAAPAPSSLSMPHAPSAPPQAPPSLSSPAITASPTLAPASPARSNSSGGPLSGFASLVLTSQRTGGTGGTGNAANAASSLARKRTRAGTTGTLADLSAAIQKSVASGMGEWDLRADGLWGNPEIQERLLRGPLGPETLKNRYHMKERDILSLYRLLYSYSVGFFTDVESLLDTAINERTSPGGGGRAGGAATGGGGGVLGGLGGGGLLGLRQELLENVFRSYAALWDEALMIVFDSEIAAVLADKTAALQALDAGVVELEALRRENEQLQSRLADFVKQNIDNMLSSRHMKQAATRLEGELHSLQSANEQLVTHMAGHAVQVTTLERQLDAARAATAAAEERAAAAEAHLAQIKTVVSEQNATLSAQYFQIKELERHVGELQENIRNLNRRRAAVLGLLSGGATDQSTDAAGLSAGGGTTTTSAHGGVASSGPSASRDGAPLAAPSGHGAHGGGGAGSGSGPSGSGPSGVLADVSLLSAEELERLLSDKTRAFNLLHADFLVKMHELEEQRSVNTALREEIKVMQASVQRAETEAADSAAAAERSRARWESGRMYVEDLEAANKRLSAKNAELVRSYWPLMTRLREAEAEMMRAREASERDREQAEHDRAEADALRAEAEQTRGALQELQELREEAASHELQLPPDLLAALPDNHAASLRRFGRSCHRRVAHLNAQVVALVDQVTSSRLRIQQLLRQLGLTDEPQLLPTPTPPHQPPQEFSLVPHAAPSLLAGAAAGAADAAEVAELRAALADRDKWLTVFVRAMSALMGQMENLMARDYETCHVLRLEQKKRKQKAARAARRASVRKLEAEASTASAAAAAAAAAGQQQAVGSSAATTPSGERSLASQPSASQPSASQPSVSQPSASQPSASQPSASPSAASAITLAPAAVGSEGQQQQQPEGSVASNPATVTEEPSTEPSSPRKSLSQPSLSGEATVGLPSIPPEASLSPPSPSGEATAAAVAAEGSATATAAAPTEPNAEEDEDDGWDDSDPTMTVACGRIAQMIGSGDSADWVQRTPLLVALDGGFERLADSAERMVEWAEGLLKRKEQTANFSQLKQRLEAVSRQLDTANIELNTLRPTAEALRQTVRGYEAKVKEMTVTVTSCKQRAEAAESRLSSTEAQLAAVSEQLKESKGAQRLLESEYWKAKDVALEAEMTTGELKAARSRALEAAAKALASVSGLEKQSRESQEQRVALEADLVGYKAWVRHMEEVERRYRTALRDLSDANAGCEERDRALAELRDRVTALEQQLRLKTVEAGSLDCRVRALGRELAEERKAASAAAAAARASAAAQLDAAIRQAGGAEAQAAAQAERVAVLEARLAEATEAVAAAQAAAAQAEAQLLPLATERDRLRAHVAASQPLLAAMDNAATAIGRRLTVLEDAVHASSSSPSSSSSGVAAGAEEGGGMGRAPAGTLESALHGLLESVEAALDAFEAVAVDAAGDATPALFGELEGLATQLINTLTKGGKEPIQSIAVLKAQLARDDKELAATRAAMAALQAARDEAVRQAAEQRAAAQAAVAAAGAANAAAQRDARRAAEAEAAMRQARTELEASGRQLSETKQAAAEMERQLQRLQRRAADLETDLTALRNQRRHLEAQAAAAAQQRAELQRRAEAVESRAVRDQDAAREARERADAAEAAAAVSDARCRELQAAVEAEQREVARLRSEVEAAVGATAEARARALGLEQQILEMQAKYADMIRHDESIEEHLRHARFEAETMRKRAAEATAEAAEVNARFEALQQRTWQLQVALQAKHGEKEDALRELVEVTHAAAAKKKALTAARPRSAKKAAEAAKALRDGIGSDIVTGEGARN